MKKDLLGLAQTSHYLVSFGLPSGVISHLQRKITNASNFAGNDMGLLCSAAEIPGSSFATADIRGNYQGIVEKMAHTRQFVQMNLEFYVDRNYNSLKFLEHWIDFIASGSEDTRSLTGARSDPSRRAHHLRMRYPDEYKSDQTKIVKFDRDYRNGVEYNFRGLFPLSLTAIPVSYQQSQILKANCIFSYDRYIAGEVSSLSQLLGTDRNNIPTGLSNIGNAFNAMSSILRGRNVLNRDVISTVTRGLTGQGVASAVNTLSGRGLGRGTSNTFRFDMF